MEETKYFQDVFEKEVSDKVEETRKIKFIISTGAKDRHKDILNMDNWELKNFNANPIVGYQHNVYGDNMCMGPNPDDVLGKGPASLETYRGKKVLVADVEFEPASINTTAEKVFRKILFGSLNAASVGILPVGKFKTEDTKDADGNVIDTTRKWEGQELLEWSIVNIPANQEAVRRSLKNHTLAGLSFVQKLLEDYGIKEIKQMKVQEILDLIDKKHGTAAAAQMEMSFKGPDPNLNKYMERLTKIKNGQA